MAVVGEFNPASAELSRLDLGGILAITPATDEGAPLRMGTTWFVGGDPDGAANDGDQDGMLDGWEIWHGLNPNDPSDALGDLDNDGATNLDEHEAGTDPEDPNSVLKIVGVERTKVGLRILYSTIPGRVYQVWRTPHLGAKHWEPISGRNMASGDVAEFLDSEAEEYGNAFYKIQLLAD